MTEVVKILVVEDDKDQRQAYEDAAEEMSTADRKIELTTSVTAGEAKTELLSTNFDGAIVDLNLEPGNPADVSGNDILAEIHERHRFPVLVVSGNLNNLADDIRRSGFLKTFDRDEPNEKIFKHLLDIHSKGITKILGGRGELEQLLNDIFWIHLADDFEGWDAGGLDSEKTLLRYMAAHLSEYLDQPGDDMNAHYHEAEFYVIPPIRKHIATGDIVERDGHRFILLSPACDVAVRGVSEGRPAINAKSLVLASVVTLNREELLRNGIIRNSDNAGARRKVLEEIMKGQREKYLFLPGYRGIAAGIADFQNLVTWQSGEYWEACRLGTVTSAFLRDIQSRFAAYYGRQGHPDLDKAGLLKKYLPNLSPEN